MKITPIIGVSVVIVRRFEAIIVRRGRAPYRGLWSLPGGKLEAGETLEDAAVREALEETGLDVEITNFVRNFDIIHKDDAGDVTSHYVLASFQARATGGTLRAGNDASEAIWTGAGRLDSLDMTPGTADYIKSLLPAITGL